jgi:hypothetical protein
VVNSQPFSLSKSNGTSDSTCSFNDHLGRAGSVLSPLVLVLLILVVLLVLLLALVTRLPRFTRLLGCSNETETFLRQLQTNVIS